MEQILYFSPKVSFLETGEMLRGPGGGFRLIFFSMQYRPLVEQVELDGAEAGDVQITRKKSAFTVKNVSAGRGTSISLETHQG